MSRSIGSCLKIVQFAIVASIAALLPACDDNSQSPMQEADSLKIVFFGDSLTAGWKLWGDLNDHLPNEINTGVSGNTTGLMLKRIQHDVLDNHPVIVVLLAGTNDLADGYDAPDGPTYPDEADLFQIIELCQAAGAKVIVGTVPPLPARYGGVDWPKRWNQVIKDGAGAYGYTVVDYYPLFLTSAGGQNLSLYIPDQVHPSYAGFQKMWPVLWGTLSRWL